MCWMEHWSSSFHKYLILSNHPAKWGQRMWHAPFTWSIIVLESPKIEMFFIPKKTQNASKPARALASARLFVPCPPFQAIKYCNSSSIMTWTPHPHIFDCSAPSKKAQGGFLWGTTASVLQFLFRLWDLNDNPSCNDIMRFKDDSKGSLESLKILAFLHFHKLHNVVIKRDWRESLLQAPPLKCILYRNKNHMRKIK